jgi:ABC-type transport system substrate-binding protein
MADNFKKYLNIDTEIVAKDTGEYAKALASKQFQTVGNQPVSMLGEPNDLMPIFLSGNAANFTGYKNAEADKLWLEQSTLLDTTKRKQLTQQIEKIILSDYLMAPQGFLKTTTVMQPYVKGYVSRDAAYCSNFAYEVVWLDK